MAHFKMNEDDDRFLQLPQDASLIFAGLGGTETWIERAQDCVVRLGVKSVGVATGPGGTIEVALHIGEDVARGRDGPAAEHTQLRASQSVQVLVKAGQRLSFRAETHAENAHPLRTVVWAGDMLPEAPHRANGEDHEGAKAHGAAPAAGASPAPP